MNESRTSLETRAAACHRSCRSYCRRLRSPKPKNRRRRQGAMQTSWRRHLLFAVPRLRSLLKEVQRWCLLRHRIAGWRRRMRATVAAAAAAAAAVAAAAEIAAAMVVEMTRSRARRTVRFSKRIRSRDLRILLRTTPSPLHLHRRPRRGIPRKFI